MNKTIHLGITDRDLAGNGLLGRYVLLSGSRERAETISKLFSTNIGGAITNPRGLDCFRGTIILVDQFAIEVISATSGMGPASYEITNGELLDCGAKRILRVGTSGTLQPNIGPGNFVVSTGAVRDELTSQHYVPSEFPAICHPDWVIALRKAAKILDLTDRTFEGITHSKDSLWAREGGAQFCPNRRNNLKYKQKLTDFGAANSDMELSVGCIQAQCRQKPVSLHDAENTPSLQYKVGGLCVVVNKFTQPGNDGEEELFSVSKQEQAEMELTLCKFAIEGVRQMALIDLGSSLI